MAEILYRLDLSYDGSRYKGWQAQDDQQTIQAVLEEVLGRIFKVRPSLSAAGRTDAGVHARHQVAAFRAPFFLDPPKLLRALNALLPQDIRVWDARLAEEGFHPRRSARARCYEYWVAPRPRVEPWLRQRCWAWPRAVHLDRLEAMASLVLGERDFSAFCPRSDPSPSKRRQVFQSHWRVEAGFLVYRITANAFLWNMVRRLVGAMVRLSGRADGVELFIAMRDNPPERVPPPAPPWGLYLHEVIYDEREFAYR